MNFAERLQQLPSVAHLAALHISSADGQALATLEPKPGQAGSLVTNHALGLLYGASNASPSVGDILGVKYLNSLSVKPCAAVCSVPITASETRPESVFSFAQCAGIGQYALARRKR